MEKSKIAEEIIKELDSDGFITFIEKADKIWQDKYVADDESIRLIVECLKNCDEKERYGYALALVNNINSLYSTGVKYIHIHKMAENIVNALFNGSENKIDIIANYDMDKNKSDNNSTTGYFSFATKLCVFYYGDDYVMYDSYMDAFIWEYIKKKQLLKETGEKIHHNSFESTEIGAQERYNNYAIAWKKVYDNFSENKNYKRWIDSKKTFDQVFWVLMKHWEELNAD